MFLSDGAFPNERLENGILFLNCDDSSECAVQSKQLKQTVRHKARMAMTMVMMTIMMMMLITTMI